MINSNKDNKWKIIKETFVKTVQIQIWKYNKSGDKIKTNVISKLKMFQILRQKLT